MAKEKARFLGMDWLLCHSRWLWLLGLLVFAILNPLGKADAPLMFFILGLVGVYNFIVLVLLSLNLLPDLLPVSTMLLDTAFSAAILYASGGRDSPLFLICLFPTLIAALRFGFELSFLIAMVLATAYWAFNFMDVLLNRAAMLSVERLVFLGLETIVLFLAAALVSLINSMSGLESRALVGKREEELKELQAARDRAKLVYKTLSEVSSTLNYQHVLGAMLGAGSLGVGELEQKDVTDVSMALLFDERSLSVAASSNLANEADKGRRIEGRSGVIWRAISSAEPVIVDDVSEDPELGAFVSLQKCRSIMCIPLRAGFETYGVVVFASQKPEAYSEEHLELVTTFSNQAVIALQNANLYQSLREEKDRIIDSEEEARKKLARDLHDGPTQSVAAITMRLNFVRLLVDRNPEQAKEELEKLEDLARRTTKEIRHMLFALRPLVLETQGLKAALEQYAQKFEETEEIPLHLEIDDIEGRLGTNIEAVAFAIVDEAVNNARKHAKADNIYVRLNIAGDLFIAEIEDDGIGFDVAEVEESYEQRGSLGILNLRERAELVDGSTTIDSEIGRGTRITLVVPLKDSI